MSRRRHHQSMLDPTRCGHCDRRWSTIEHERAYQARYRKAYRAGARRQEALSRSPAAMNALRVQHGVSGRWPRPGDLDPSLTAEAALIAALEHGLSIARLGLEATEPEDSDRERAWRNRVALIRVVLGAVTDDFANGGVASAQAALNQLLTDPVEERIS